MNLKVNSLGAEPKKVVALGVLALVGGFAYLYNRPSSPSPSSSAQPSAAVAPLPVPLKGTSRPSRARGFQRGNARTMEFHPSLKASREAVDPSSIDPTLRLDLLDRVQDVQIGAINRSLFESYGKPPAALASNIQEPKKIDVAFQYAGPPAPAAEVAKVEPPAPPIPLKFYGFINPAKAGAKRAFFLDGDDIIVATEGQLIKGRYKIVRIGINSAEVEDTQFKNHKQTLALVEEQAS